MRDTSVSEHLQRHKSIAILIELSEIQSTATEDQQTVISWLKRFFSLIQTMPYFVLHEIKAQAPE